mmetsp:Transcript_49/g.101  ORF Transcript_49/g.101 Transcript_49/m.101 type:complete len:304 (+) Transcript_49:2876-3787(+)
MRFHRFYESSFAFVHEQLPTGNQYNQGPGMQSDQEKQDGENRHLPTQISALHHEQNDDGGALWNRRLSLSKGREVPGGVSALQRLHHGLHFGILFEQRSEASVSLVHDTFEASGTGVGFPSTVFGLKVPRGFRQHVIELIEPVFGLVQRRLRRDGLRRKIVRVLLLLSGGVDFDLGLLLFLLRFFHRGFVGLNGILVVHQLFGISLQRIIGFVPQFRSEVDGYYVGRKLSHHAPPSGVFGSCSGGIQPRRSLFSPPHPFWFSHPHGEMKSFALFGVAILIFTRHVSHSTNLVDFCSFWKGEVL